MVSKLAKSSAIAFRVRTNDKFQPPQLRYWRGAILPVNNGMTWIVGRDASQKWTIKTPKEYEKSPIKQEIILEPRYNEWLFVQDTPNWVQFGERFNQKKLKYSRGDVFSLSSPTDKALLYRTYSFNINKQTLDKEDQQFYLKTPEEKDQRVLDLVSKVKAATSQETAKNTLEFFRNQFRYTLEPGAMKTNNVGEFLFEKKVGFCEHFAVSFAHIMRLSGVPSRVVVGFQGGQLNELGDYLIVKDNDAHAWTEIWSMEQNQWLRYDPTEVVAPLRLELGGEVFNRLTQDQLLAQSGSDVMSSYQQTWSYQLFGRSALAIDALATRWNYFLLTYNKEGQQQLLERLGIGRLNGGVLFSISLVIFLIFYFWSRWKNGVNRKLTAAEKSYNRLCEILAQKGINREVSEGPRDFLTRATRGWPDQRTNLELYHKIYIPWRYSANSPSKNELESLNNILRELKKAKGATV